MKKENSWKTYTAEQLQELNGLADRYREAEQLDIVSADLLERNRRMMKKSKESK